MSDKEIRDGWIDWRRMHPLVRPEDLTAIDRAQIHAAQQPPPEHRTPREVLDAE